MGIWELIVSNTDRLISKTPFLNSIKNSCEELNVDWREQLGSFATKFIKNAAQFSVQEGYKLIPGGEAVAKIISMTAKEMEAENYPGASKKKASSGNKGNEETESTGEIHVYRTAKEGLTDQPSRESSGMDKKQDLNVEKTEDETKDLILSSQYNNRRGQLIVNSDVKSAVTAIPEGIGGSPTSIRSKL